jgi:hypothetical protein
VLQIHIKQYHCFDEIVLYCSWKYVATDRTKGATDKTFVFSHADNTFHKCMSSVFGIWLVALTFSKGYYIEFRSCA